MPNREPAKDTSMFGKPRELMADCRVHRKYHRKGSESKKARDSHYDTAEARYRSSFFQALRMPQLAGRNTWWLRRSGQNRRSMEG